MELWGKSLAELQDIIEDLGYPKYRGKQLHDYLYRRGLHDFAQMLQLPKNLRQDLGMTYTVGFPEIVRHDITPDRKTAKILLKYRDNSLVESVLMSHDYGYSVCISTQVGCAVGCKFCASGKNGLVRNLSMAEMLAQIYTFMFLFNIRIHSLVLMGSGEPLQNYEEVLKFIHICAATEGLGMSYRNMTLSTSGIVPQIYRLADEKIPITLAISLHAPNDEIRNQIMPISKAYPLQELIPSLVYYFHNTGRRITCEYILIDRMNSRIEHAEELARLLKPLKCHVNLIPINENEGIDLYRPSLAQIDAFCEHLNRRGINATVRKEMGSEIQAACGQLKLRYMKETPSFDDK